MRSVVAGAAWLALLVVGCRATPTDDAERLAEEHRGDRPEATGAIEGDPARPVTAGPAAYGDFEGEALRGYAARPQDGRTRGGLVVIHEWWGLNDNIRAMTRKLAGEGYVVLAVDLYEGEVAEQPDRARELVREAGKTPERIEAHLEAAVDYLERQGVERVGTLGWCFGGGWALNTALLLPDRLSAAVVYYGRLETDPGRLGSITAPVLGIFGDQDQAIPVATVESFASAMRDAGREVEIHVYEGAGHAFANPSGTRYDADAAADAWAKTLRFLDRHLARDAGA